MKGSQRKGINYCYLIHKGALTYNLVLQINLKFSFNLPHGHPHFSLLKLMLPSLFENVSIENFHCDVCEFAKHRRVPFPLSSINSVEPVSLIH